MIYTKEVYQRLTIIRHALLPQHAPTVPKIPNMVIDTPTTIMMVMPKCSKRVTSEKSSFPEVCAEFFAEQLADLKNVSALGSSFSTSPSKAPPFR